MLGFFGFLIVGGIVFLLLKKVTVPSIAFIAVPTVICLIAGYAGLIPEEALMNGRNLEPFSFLTVGRYIRTGVRGTYEVAALFIFSITFFCLMDDTGMFDRIIGGLSKKVGNNIVLVCMLTTLIAIIAHLDGSGASTFLITIPAMLPVFKKLKMRNSSLMLLCVGAMGVMNLVPWGGPTMRAATVVNMDPGELWRLLLPIQGLGIVLAFASAFIVAKLEIKNGAGYDPNYTPTLTTGADDTQSAEKKTCTSTPKIILVQCSAYRGNYCGTYICKCSSILYFYDFYYNSIAGKLSWCKGTIKPYIRTRKGRNHDGINIACRRLPYGCFTAK